MYGIPVQKHIPIAEHVVGTTWKTNSYPSDSDSDSSAAHAHRAAHDSDSDSSSAYFHRGNAHHASIDSSTAGTLSSSMHVGGQGSSTAPGLSSSSVHDTGNAGQRRQEVVLGPKEALTLTMQGWAGESVPFPCMQAQSKSSLIIQTRRVKPVYRFSGYYQGTCGINPLCDYATPEEQTRCLSWLPEYSAPGNMCKVRLIIEDNLLTEHVYDCGNKTAWVPEGQSVGYISEIADQYKEIESIDTRYVLLRTRGFIVNWFRSSRGRRRDERTMFTYTFGVTGEIVPGNPGAYMEVMIQDKNKVSDGYLVPDVDVATGRIMSALGMCRRMSLVPRYPTHTKLPPAVPTFATIRELQDLRTYRACNDSLASVRDLELSTAQDTCGPIVRGYLMRNALRPFTQGSAVAYCNAECWPIFEQRLENSVQICGDSWRRTAFTDVYTWRIFKKLLFGVTARFWAKVSCLSNRQSLPCIRTIADYPGLFSPETCPAYTPAALVQMPDFNFTDLKCAPGCIESLRGYQAMDGCCTTSIAQEQVAWALALRSGSTLKSFTLDLGDATNPWTTVGSVNGDYGVQFQVDGAGCGGRDVVTADCAMVAKCEYRDWEGPCCNLKCVSDGFKMWPSVCFCTCPPGLVGPTCAQRSPSIRFSVVLQGEVRCV
jgi:hypothetical protein